MIVAFGDANGDGLNYYQFEPCDGEPSVSEVLIDAFGMGFDQATLDQKLALIESISFLMRQRDCSLENAVTAIIPQVRMPDTLRVSHYSRLKDFNEGLTLLAMLYTAVAGDISRLIPLYYPRAVSGQ